jgi:hypothetical protein
VAGLSPRLTSVAVDPRTRTAFELAPRDRGGDGPFRLHRIGLAGAAPAAGPQFPVSGVSLAAGYAWVSRAVVRGQSARLVLYQVSPATLRVIRSWRLTGWLSSGFGPVPVTGGPRGTVWVGYADRLRRLNARTGATVHRVRLPSSVAVSDVAADPAGRHLYVAGDPLPDGGAVIDEYSATSGRLLASQRGAPVKYSAGGAILTAVPSGAWATFRTGMLGQAVLLRRHGLSVVPLPARDRQVYSWAMGASTSYGGGSLWLSQSSGGRTACVAPATGRVRSRGALKAMGDGGYLLAVSASGRVAFAVGRPGLVAISAPPARWR